MSTTVLQGRGPLAAVGRLSRGGSLLRAIVRRPAGLLGLAIVGGLVVLAIAGPLIAPYSAAQQDIAARMQGPTGAHLLGTDQLGRDLLSRLILGVRVELGVALPSVLIALLAGLALGVVAGYVGGRLDGAIVIVLDTLQSTPAVVLALILLALLGPSLGNVIVVVAVGYTPNYARVVRALVQSAKQNQFAEAERSLGASPLRIVGVHIVPNVIGPLFVLLAMDLPFAISIEAGLSFLGIGVQPPTPSWGVILSDGFGIVRETPWPVVWSGITLIVTTLGFTMLGETLRDVVDPKLARAGRKSS